VEEEGDEGEEGMALLVELDMRPGCDLRGCFFFSFFSGFFAEPCITL
jgi:hypothetical protein